MVSIIIPCYNQARFLNATLGSVLTQTFEDWECIIVNDGSQDNTREVVQNWTEKDKRFKYIEKGNGGVSSSRNAGLEEAKGDFYLFLDGDDLIHPQKLELNVKEMQNEAFDIVLNDFLRFKKNLNHLKRAFCDLSKQEYTLKSIILGWDSEFTIPIHCALFRKELFNNIKFVEHLKAKEDWIMWIDVFKQNPRVSYINETLSYYRRHSSNMTKDNYHMNTNHVKATHYILKNVPDSFRGSFIDKIINDNARNIYSLENRFKKYKKISIGLGVFGILLLILLLITLLT